MWFWAIKTKNVTKQWPPMLYSILQWYIISEVETGNRAKGTQGTITVELYNDHAPKVQLPHTYLQMKPPIYTYCHRPAKTSPTSHNAVTSTTSYFTA